MELRKEYFHKKTFLVFMSFYLAVSCGKYKQPEERSKIVCDNTTSSDWLMIQNG